MDTSALTKLGLGVLAFDSALAVYNSWGDPASVAFVLAADAALALLLLLCLLRKFERARAQYSALATVAVAVLLCTTALDTYRARRDAAAAALVFLSYAILLALTGAFLAGFARQSQAKGERDQPKATQMDSSALTKVGLGALAFNSALAIYNSWGDAASVAFVLAADAALALLFLRLQPRQFERARGGRGEDDGVGRINKGAALATLAVAALLCTTALYTYSARRDAAATAVVFLSYAILLALTGVFLAGFARARRGQQGRAGAGLVLLEEELKAMLASGVAALVPPVVAAAVWAAMAFTTVTGGFWELFAPL